MQKNIWIESHANGCEEIENVYENALAFFFTDWQLHRATDKGELYLVECTWGQCEAFSSWMENVMDFSKSQFEILDYPRPMPDALQDFIDHIS